MLLERRPEAVSKAVLLDLVWPQTFVNESSVARLATELRQALGDEARAARYVRTVYAFGYAFCGDAFEEPAPPRRSLAATGLRLVMGRREIALLEGENILGRDEDARAHIDSTKASRRHARIVVAGTRATIEDLASKNGTFLRGRRLVAMEALQDGDEIVIGATSLTFRAGPSRSTETDTALRGPM